MSIRLPIEPRARDLAKMDMLAELFVRSMAQKHLVPLIGPDRAVRMAHDELINDPNYWLAVFAKAKVIVNL